MTIVEQAYTGVLTIGFAVGVGAYGAIIVLARVVRPKDAPTHAVATSAEAVRRIAIAVAVLAGLFPALYGVVAIHRAQDVCGWPEHRAAIAECQ